MKNVAVLTSGNDCPGMNAALRAVVRTIIHQNGRIWGVRNGYKGLLEDKIEEALHRNPVNPNVVSEHTFTNRVETIIEDYEKKFKK